MVELADVEAHELLEAIAEHPDDPAPWTVYADLLQTIDHPRGELISLMMERERRPSLHLLELQRELLVRRRAALMPGIAAEVIAGWRRGFASELRLTAAEQLVAVQREPSLSLVTTARLEMVNVEAWRAVFEAVRLPWKHVTLEVGEQSELELGPVLAALPALETLRLFGHVTGRWSAARSDTLAQLTVIDADAGDLEVAALPNLAELRFFGTSTPSFELRATGLWNRLSRVVIARNEGGEIAEDEGPEVCVVEPLAGPRIPVATVIAVDADNDDDEYFDDDEYEGVSEYKPSTAFFVIDRPLERSLLARLAAGVAGSMSARVCTVPGLPGSVVQLFGSPESELLPYKLALALEVAVPAARIALIDVDDTRTARHLVLGKPQVRATEPESDDAVRRVLDLAIGFDPGTAILRSIFETLATTPIERLHGTGPVEQLTMIDPSSAPLVMVPEPENVEADDGDEYYDPDDDSYWIVGSNSFEVYEPALVDEVDEEEDPVDPADAARRTSKVGRVHARVEHPVAPIDDVPHIAEAAELEPPSEDLDDERLPVVVLPEAVRLEQDEPEPSDELELEEWVPQDHDALQVPPYDRPELWFDLHEYWEDRAIPIDDATFEARWPDPERAGDWIFDVEDWIAEAMCGGHRIELDRCGGCGVAFCPACEGEGECSACYARLHQDHELADQQLTEVAVGVGLGEAAGGEQLAGGERAVDPGQ